jgi:hypothetical protein
MNQRALLDAYFNGASSRGDMASLESELLRDQAASNEFAELARVEAALDGHFGGQRDAAQIVAQFLPGDTGRSGNRRPVIAWAVAAVVILLGAAVAIAWLNHNARRSALAQNSSATGARAPARPPRIAGNPDPESAGRRRANATQARREEEMRRLLANFYLPDTNFEKFPLNEALKLLGAKVRDYNHADRPELDALTLAIDETSGAVPSIPVTLKQSGLTLFTTLRLLAAQTGQALKFTESGVVFVAREPNTAPGKLVSREFQVPRDFFEQNEETDQGATADANAAPATARLSPQEWLAGYGLRTRSEGALAYDASNSTITIRDTRETVELMEEIVLADQERREAPTVQARSVLIEFTGGHPAEGRVFTEAEFADWLAETERTTGAHVLAAPSVATRIGRPFVVDVGGPAPGAGQSASAFQGFRLDLIHVMEGEWIHLSGSFDVGPAPESTTPAASAGPNVGNPPVPAPHAVDVEALIPSGHTALISLTEKPDGPQLVAAITLKLSSPKGEILDPRTPVR